MSEQKTNPETPETQSEQEIASINGKHYYKSSMTEEQIAAFEQAISINQKINGLKIDIRNLQYGAQFLTDLIEKDIDTMEEYIPETPEVAEEAEAAE